MNWYSLYPLISAIFVSVLGLLVFLKNPKNRLNWTFALHAVAISLWLFGTFMMFLSRGDNTASIFWDRFIYGGVVFIPAFMYHFCLALTNRKRDFFLYLAYFLSIFFLIISQTNYFVSGIFVYQWGVHTKAQFFHHFFLIYFSSYAVAWFILVYRYYRKVESILTRYQIKYFFIAFLILFTIGPTAYLPAYGISIYPFSFLSGLVFTIIIAYAILKYRLMDMRIIARAMLAYGSDSIFAFLFYSLLILVYPIIWGSVYSSYAMLAGVVVAPVFVLTMFSFDAIVKKILDRYFFYSLYDFRQTITKLSAELNHYPDLDKIVELIVDTVKNTLGLNRAGVLLIDKSGGLVKYKIAKVTGFDITNGISLVKDNFLTKYLKQTSKPLVREELTLLARDAKNAKESQSFLNLEKEMAHIEASLCLPLLSGKELLGIIVLGVKNSGDPYTQEDLNLLSTLSNQAGIAIDNARLYSETKNFNKLLQSKVDEQTKELMTRAQHLEKLLKMREEFLDIASHQLKTPVSVIRGTISMFRDGSMDKLPKAEQQKFMDNIYHKTEKLNVIISDILRASEIDSDEFKIDPLTAQAARVEDILKSIYDDLKDLAGDKGIALKLNLPPKATPMILTSADFLEQAIYNLVDNAIKYTAKGSVTIDLSASGGTVVVKVSDTGIGIPETDKKKMFDKFSRAKNAVDMYADGSGLGLFIVKRIVEAHPGGKVEFESEENKGTTFTVTLQAVK
jgi:signal transduction histidine kinase